MHGREPQSVQQHSSPGGGALPLAIIRVRRAGRASENFAAANVENDIMPLRSDQMIVRILLLATTILLSSEFSAASKGSAVIHDDPYNPHHIDDLPADVRQYIATIRRKSPAPLANIVEETNVWTLTSLK
jgi:hypothetical protein